MMKNCYRCGGPAEISIEDGSAVCDDCEDQFQAAMRAEYPFGQCSECGAAYEQATCDQGKVHTFAMHPEGGCSQWGDVADLDYSKMPGYCGYGCTPPPGYARAYQHYWRTITAGFGQEKAAREYAARRALAFINVTDDDLPY